MCLSSFTSYIFILIHEHLSSLIATCSEQYQNQRIYSHCHCVKIDLGRSHWTSNAPFPRTVWRLEFIHQLCAVFIFVASLGLCFLPQTTGGIRRQCCTDVFRFFAPPFAFEPPRARHTSTFKHNSTIHLGHNFHDHKCTIMYQVA